MITTCFNDCCQIKINPYYRSDKCFNIKRKKAGVFFFDPCTNKVLLIQSRGRLWGPPKGTINLDETPHNCAIREVKEETGIDIEETKLKEFIVIHNKAFYFFVEKNECSVDIQNHIIENDANGISWININCLIELIKSNKMKLNSHCKIAFRKFLNVYI